MLEVSKIRLSSHLNKNTRDLFEPTASSIPNNAQLWSPEEQTKEKRSEDEFP